MRLWDTPVPIPNTTVKTQAADDTWRETARESKRLPDSIKKTAIKADKKSSIKMNLYVVTSPKDKILEATETLRAYSSAG